MGKKIFINYPQKFVYLQTCVYTCEISSNEGLNYVQLVLKVNVHVRLLHVHVLLIYI